MIEEHRSRHGRSIVSAPYASTSKLTKVGEANIKLKYLDRKRNCDSIGEFSVSAAISRARDEMTREEGGLGQVRQLTSIQKFKKSETKLSTHDDCVAIGGWDLASVLGVPDKMYL